MRACVCVDDRDQTFSIEYIYLEHRRKKESKCLIQDWDRDAMRWDTASDDIFAIDINYYNFY